MDDLTTDEIGARLVGYAGQMAALTARFLELLAEFDRRGGCGGEGIMSCAHWLSWRTGLSIRTAHDHLRIAHALPELPLLRRAFVTGTNPSAEPSIPAVRGPGTWTARCR